MKYFPHKCIKIKILVYNCIEYMLYIIKLMCVYLLSLYEKYNNNNNMDIIWKIQDIN